ncbi:hypothetical protein H4O18_07035 [Arenibacter sp. BSSL-BM3]|uniref:Uncharacterized protein n=1 Tax=Arenibacter arenosicollis TaxID=2762274 RepID=A0ABR7QKN0_9FLAO|nr:hypothetical protein [Arenibacter arenosicollis]MBC8767742.1 hypothetical protein [Arenibacter arenosicollis]
MGTILFKHQVLGTKEIQRILIITLCWALVHSVFYIYRYFSTLDLVHLHKLSGTFEFWPDFIATLFLSVFGGLIGGTILVSKRYVSNSYKSYEYGTIGSRLHFVLWCLLLLAIGLYIWVFVFYNLSGEVARSFSNSVQNLVVDLSVPSFFATMAIWGLLISAT